LSPSYSLTLGAILIGVPALFLSVSDLFKKNEDADNQLTKKLYWVIPVLNILMFIALGVIAYIKFYQGYSVYLGFNGSGIADEAIFTDYRISVFKIAYKYIKIALSGFVVMWAVSKWTRLKISPKLQAVFAYFIIFAAFAVSVSIFSLYMVYRTKTIVSPTYDFGIFTQMFYNMKNGNGMLTTLERDGVLSHLAVHVSPIYYLMLPAYMIFPYPETLQVLQVVIAASGVIPLVFIAKEMKLSKLITTLVAIIYLSYPAIIMSSYYDLHENCFLAPLLLLTFLFGYKNKYLLALLSAILVLMVKEDSAVYVVTLGLYFIVDNIKYKQKFHEVKGKVFLGGIMILMSVAYFFIVTGLLNSQGDGAMFYRYDNLIPHEDLGLIGVVLGIFQDPSYLLATVFSPEKVSVLIVLFVCVGFIPFIVRNAATYILLLPLLIINFASGYYYQHVLGFQYFYGSTSLLILMILLAIKEKPLDKVVFKWFSTRDIIHVMLFIAVSFSLAFGIKAITDRKYDYLEYNAHSEIYISIKETLLSIPEDKKVCASEYFNVYLSNREYLYDFEYHDFESDVEPLDYVILDRRIREDLLEDMIEVVEESGYVLSNESTDYVFIFVPAE